MEALTVCCKTTVMPMVREVAEALLAIGQFERTSPSGWVRSIPEEDTAVSAYLHEDRLTLSLHPAVSSMIGHAHKRVAAGVMYEMACKYAERVGGLIQQEGINVPACQTEGKATRMLAVYPAQRFDYEQLCPGFRAVFLGELEGA